MKKFLLILVCFSVLFSGCAFASDVEVWHDPSLNLKNIKKIFIMPIEADLKAGSKLIPAKQLKSNMHSWAVDGINSAVKKGTVIIKSLDALLEDMKFIYSDENSEESVFFKRAAEMGYKAFIEIHVTQNFDTKHVPEEIRTYTVYREIEKRDSKGRLIETIRIPEEKTEVIPAHDVTYLYTTCRPELYKIEDYDGDYSAVVNYEIYREYQGGAVINVVENILKASLKKLFKK